MRVSAAGALVTGAIAAPTLLAAGTAQAATCGTATVAGTPCSLTGTVTLTGGSLTLTSPGSLNWTANLDGLNQSLVDTSGGGGDEAYTVNDATGSGSGWHVSTTATTFTNGTHTLPDIGTFVTNGSVSSITSTAGPSATCTGSCTLPTDTTSYPVAITTAAATPAPFTIYDTTGGGLGQMVIGGSTAANPVGWWVNVPASASAGSYLSTITMQITSGP